MISRRDAIKTCLGAAATAVVSPLLAGDNAAPPIWKTASGILRSTASVIVPSILLLASITAAEAFEASSGASRAGEKPNIIFILCDDLGWAEPGCYGNAFNETPNIDRLARDGMRFAQAYAAAPVCSPYRAAFLTGQYPARIGITDYLRPYEKRPLPTAHVTIAEMLRAHGYATGMIGKWHLSGYKYHDAPVEVRATDHGFDEEIASEIKGVGNGVNFWPYIAAKQPIRWLNIKEKKLPGNEYLIDRMSLEAVQFIRRHKDRPFFLYLSHYATHSILQGRESLVNKYRGKHPPGESSMTKCRLCREAGLEGDPHNHWARDHNPHLAAMLESIDDGVGSIVKELDELGLAENTMLVFTSDNGGQGEVSSQAPLRGAKSMLYEGGIRIPLIVRWPRAVPAGSVCETTTMNTDFYPTFLAAAGIEGDPRQKIDGSSILSVLKDPENKMNRDTLYWHYPLSKPHFLGGRSSGAIRQGDWKLIEFFDGGEIELYDLAADVGESNNLASEHPNEVKRLLKKMKDWRKEVHAEMTR